MTLAADSQHTGFTVHVPTGTIQQIRFELAAGDAQAWRVGPDGKSSWMNGSYTLGRDLFLTSEEAMQAAVKARDKKVESLKKQVQKLQATEFSVLYLPS